MGRQFLDKLLTIYMAKNVDLNAYIIGYIFLIHTIQIHNVQRQKKETIKLKKEKKKLIDDI